MRRVRFVEGGVPKISLVAMAAASAAIVSAQTSDDDVVFKTLGIDNNGVPYSSEPATVCKYDADGDGNADLAASVRRRAEVRCSGVR